MRFKKYILILLSILTITWAYGQEVGDFRSSSSGNWTTVAIWETYNGTSWVAATTYPGQTTGTNDVFIIGGFSVTLTSTITNSINSVIIGDGSGGTDNFYIDANSGLNTQLINLTSGGYAEWTSNASFYLPSGAAFVIDGGTLATDNPCSAAKRLYIGTTIYSTCNGGAGSDFSFTELQDQGGSLSVSPSSNSPICEGSTLNLFANPSGTGSSSATFSWSGTGPGSYSFSSSDEDPVISSLIAGSYTYTITITDSNGNANSSSIDILITAQSISINTQPQDQAIFVNSNATFTTSTSNADTYQWQVSTDSGVNYTDVADGLEYAGSNGLSLTVISPGVDKSGYRYRVVVLNSSSPCPGVVSGEANLSVRIRTVLFNRRITYRVQKQ